MPDIGFAVAVEIDCVFVVLRRQELGEAHGAAPGRAQIAARHAVLQHLQGVQEFVAEEILALADIGLRGQDAQRVVRLAFGAVISLARPDRQHHIAGHAEGFLDARERGAVLRGEFAPLRGEPGEGRLAQISRRRLHEFRLARRRLFRPAGQREIGQRIIRREPARGGVESGARDAELMRSRPQRLQPLLKRGVGEGRRGDKEPNQDDCDGLNHGAKLSRLAARGQHV